MSWTTIVGSRIDTLLRELLVGAYEREVSNVSTIASGAYIQGGSFASSYYFLQDTIETRIDYTGYGDRWVNHVDGPLNATETAFEFYDRSSFATVSGLNNPGLWRRKVNMGDAFSYGKMQTGDIIGSWIFEDLQAALTAMKWVRNDTHYENYGNVLRSGTGATQASAEAAYAAAEFKYGSGYELRARADDTGATKILRRISLPLSVYATALERVSSGECVAYFRGDAVAQGTVFNSFGDSGVVEGVGTTLLREAVTSSYPDDKIIISGGYDAGVLFPSPIGQPSWSGGAETGYNIPAQSIGDYLMHIQYLLKPDFTN